MDHDPVANQAVAAYAAAVKAANPKLAADICKRYGLAEPAAEQTAQVLTHEHVRAAGGIVHSDGNIFFTNIEKLNNAITIAARRAHGELTSRTTCRKDWVVRRDALAQRHREVLRRECVRYTASTSTKIAVLRSSYIIHRLNGNDRIRTAPGVLLIWIKSFSTKSCRYIHYEYAYMLC